MNDKSDKRVAGIIVRSQNNPSTADISQLVDGFFSDLQPRRSFHGFGEEVDIRGQKRELPDVFYAEQPTQGGGRPRSFWVTIQGPHGSWELEAHFGSCGSHKLATDLLQALILNGIEKVMAWGPPIKGENWYYECISPAKLLDKMGPMLPFPRDAAALVCTILGFAVEKE